jgi:small Trp-rich protein
VPSMILVLIGLALLAAKLTGWEPVATWAWWWVLAPFGLAPFWWAFADGSGLTQRRIMQRMDERRRKRREQAMRALGMTPRGKAHRANPPS